MKPQPKKKQPRAKLAKLAKGIPEPEGRPGPTGFRLDETDKRWIERLAAAEETSRHDAGLAALRLGIKVRAAELDLKPEA